MKACVRVDSNGVLEAVTPKDEGSLGKCLDNWFGSKVVSDVVDRGDVSAAHLSSWSLCSIKDISVSLDSS